MSVDLMRDALIIINILQFTYVLVCSTYYLFGMHW